jgi:polysaccharide biosynthesis/export protein
MKLCYCLLALVFSSHIGANAQPAQFGGNEGLSVVQAAPRAPISIPVAPGPTGQSVTEPIDPRISAPRPQVAQSNDKTVFSPVSAGVKQAVPVVGIGADYLVGPNDLLEIEVFDLENLKRTVRVNAAGAISLPLIGGVIVAGLTAEKVEEVIAKRYSEKYLQNPQVSVFIKEFTTQRITVEGAVQKPGIYPLTGQITLLRALALAGGAGQIANMGEVIVFRTSDRGVRQAAVFDVDSIRSGKGDDPIIKGDDLIVVQRDNSRRLLKDSLFRDIIDSINPFSVFARP